MPGQRVIAQEDLDNNPILAFLGAELGWVCAVATEAGSLTQADIDANAILGELGAGEGYSVSVFKPDQPNTADA